MRTTKLLFTIAILGLATVYSKGQVTLQAFTGYQFFGSAYTAQGQLRIQPSNVLGAVAEFKLKRTVGFSLMYTYQNTGVILDRTASFYEQQLFEMDVHYIMGGTTYHRVNDTRFTPFGGGLIGMCIMDPLERSRSSEYFFAVGLQGGVQVAMTDRLGFNFRAQMLLPITNVGASLWCGSGGCDVGLSGGSTLVQMNLSAGIDLKLGN